MGNRKFLSPIELPDGYVVSGEADLGTSDGGASVHAGDDPPTGTPEHGALWIDTDDELDNLYGAVDESRILGYAEQYNEQLDITSPGSDITGLSVTVDIPAGGRKIRAHSEGVLRFGTGASSSVFWRIRQDGTLEVCRDRTFRTFESNERWHVQTSRVFEVSAGQHTFNVQCECTASSLRMEASAPATLLIEDMGPLGDEPFDPFSLDYRYLRSTMPFAKYQHTTGQSLAVGVHTQISFDTIIFSQGTWTPVTTSEITIPEAGIYEVGANFRFDTGADANEFHQVSVTLNSASVSVDSSLLFPQTNANYMVGSDMFEFGAGDVLRVFGYHTKSNTINISTWSSIGTLSIRKVA